MTSKHNATPLRRQALPAVLTGILLGHAAPAAQAQAPRSPVGNPATFNANANVNTSTNAEVLEMFRGEVRIVHVPGTIKRIAIGNGKLISANVVDGNLMLLGEEAGITSLVVWNGKGIALQTTVRIGKGEMSASIDQLRAVLRSVSGLRVDPVGSTIVLSGVVHREMVPVVKAATQDMKNVIDTTTVDEGDALKKTVHFKVQIMEITRNAQRNLGIAWDSSFNGPNIAGSATFASGAQKAVMAGTNYFLAGIASDITSRINFAVDNGDAYILATPELNTKSGGTATFLAGGEVPIPKAGALGTTDVEYKPYGIKLNINPVVDSNNVISAHLTTEISQIDPSVTYGGMPGFLTRNTSSDISMRAGETLAISGLVSADALNDSNGMPFLGSLPVIGQLFRSDAFRAKKSDLVIFVTPVISDPALAPNTGLLARADRLDDAYRKVYGNPSPLLADIEANTTTPVARRTIGPTPALTPTPVRSEPQQPQPLAMPARSPAIGLTEAIRMLNNTPPVPTVSPADAAPADAAAAPSASPPNVSPVPSSTGAPISSAMPSATIGKTPPTQISVLGDSSQ
jgi:pilus assembly protein CpaC